MPAYPGHYRGGVRHRFWTSTCQTPSHIPHRSLCPNLASLLPLCLILLFATMMLKTLKSVLQVAAAMAMTPEYSYLYAIGTVHMLRIHVPKL